MAKDLRFFSMAATWVKYIHYLWIEMFFSLFPDVIQSLLSVPCFAIGTIAGQSIITSTTAKMRAEVIPEPLIGIKSS